MLIEAYGVTGAIALSDRHSLDFLKLLIKQTAERRKSEETRKEEREAKIIAKKEDEFFNSKNIKPSVKIKTKTGETKEINLAQFFVTQD